MKTFIYMLKILGIALPSLFATVASSGQNYFTLDHISRMVNISDLQISEDGNFIMFIASRRNMEKNSMDRELVVLNIQTRERQILGKNLKGITSPRWMNNGDVALVADSDNKRQVYIIKVKSGQARMTTKSRTNVISFLWSPMKNG